MTSIKRTGLLAAAILVAAGGVVAPSLRAASPSDPAGVPFLTFAQALVRSDYTLACAQISTALLREADPTADEATLRSACVTAAQSEADQIDRDRFASTRIVTVSVTPGRARVTVQTTFHDLAPIATGTTIVEDGVWRIREPLGTAHVGQSYLYRIPSEGMLPALRVGDTALVDQAAYRHRKPAIGDVVLFRPPTGAENANECGKRPPKGQACAVATRGTTRVKFIKRIVAGPGDRISIRRGRVVRNGRRAKEPFITPCRGDYGGCDFPRTFTVAPRRYYVLGDNRGASDDSRFWGPVARSTLLGRLIRVIPKDPAG